MKSIKKVILITGGAKGIGHSIISLFANKENLFKIYSFDVLEPKNPIPNVTYIKCDISLENEIAESLLKIVEPNLDILINNAGVFKAESIETISMESFDKIININLRAPFLLTKLCLPYFKKSEFPSIINISSTRGLMSEPNNEAYSSSKGGLISLTTALAISLGPHIRVNCISPGWINVTNENLKEIDKTQHPVGRVGEGEDIGNMCLFLSDEKLSGFITGQNFVVDGGMTKKMIYTE